MPRPVNNVTGKLCSEVPMMTFTGRSAGNSMAASNHSRVALRLIRSVVGDDGIRDLCAEKGGTEIWIPRHCDPDHWMSRLFCVDVVNDICSKFNVVNANGQVVGNTRIFIPTSHSRIQALFDQIEGEVRDALIAGRPVRDIVREVGISERRVRAHLKFLRERGVVPQPDRPGAKAALQSKKPVIERRNSRASKTEAVDKLLMEGRTNRTIMITAQVGLTLVRNRRRLLLLNGSLPVGRRPAPDLAFEEDR